ncbi:hypothetical protein [Heyndrickxia sporothermodurans]|jgi:hypothetical protein|uniref:hypothetical protein n=1 Tax=Heyndrickxia sporothermodurans TaxID=46224 RepID=UPI000D3C0947|nr:hypothetical protein [Heyndrickxia sporothermodurans]PTY92998.1 hypothetical protein B5V90_02645 [Heyndrickxia sporothermodurans]
MIDQDKFKQQAVVKLSDFSKRKAVAAEPSIEETSSSDQKDARAEMQGKIATAKLHANKEMESFRKATEEYIGKIRELIVFEGIDSIVEELFLDSLLRSIIAPTIKGQQIPGMPEEDYRTFRTQLYKALINHYVDGK